MRRAFTLIEILISLVVTLMMMAAVVTLFEVVTTSVSGSRALLETADRLRAARNRISLDLQGATVTPKPPRRPESDEGYLEIVEGANKDSDFAGMTVANVTFASLFGDCDDALLLTTRSRGEPFIGKAAGTTAESQVAEVAYFLRQDGPTIGFDTTGNPVKLFTLYRRCMLVMPSASLALGTDGTMAFYDTFDVSARYDGTNRVANSLGDLTKPERRFARLATPVFPKKFDTAVAGFAGARLGDDVILTNVLAFDVQVFDPGAPVYVVSGVAVEPRDSGYSSQLGTGTSVSFGAYADPGYGPSYSPATGNPAAMFTGNPNSKSGYTTTRPFVYDTWSLHYEADGVLQSGASADQGLNGLDDDGDGTVDNSAELDTLPPYAAPLRGLRITIRVYEPGSQQIRQVTVVQDFQAN